MARTSQDRLDEMLRRSAACLSPAFAASRVAPLIGETHADGCSVEVVRAKATRVTLRYSFPSGSTVCGKVYRNRPARSVYDMLRALWEAGFNDTGHLRIPEPLGFLEAQNMVFLREPRGTPLYRQLVGCAPEAAGGAVRAAARWLAALHSAHLPCLDQEAHPERLKLLKGSDVSVESAAVEPEHLAALLEFLGYLEQLAEAVVAAPIGAPTHGRFTPHTVFLDGETLTVVDLDGLSISDPGKDVATFAAKLKYRHLFKTGGCDLSSSRLASEFLEEYAASARHNLANLPFYMALYCLKEFAKSTGSAAADASVRRSAEQFCRSELKRCLAAKHGNASTSGLPAREIG